MSGSASSSSRKKGRGETVSIHESVSRYEEMIKNMESSIKLAEEEIETLKKEKRVLEEYERGS
ncbi:hypothetical protein FOQG_17297 [Fusarium oxysporum f. sp. raphani 54005]|uniref:Uncharacterized protein n=2 Tax=Fusarium oxysporum TaxID=5507 RepID=X0B782_FUSOX|nr:hypothetical protein FOQG_17297 [Fusarium oxysporum f. sp. raphani 54005]EXL66948.1 hypothetical protein FOPG_16906 [Fusarium oxysporum f. sp. conglutinans race 2 54008]